LLLDTQFACLTHFGIQLAALLKYNIPRVNSFDSRDFIPFSQFLLLFFSFSFYKHIEKTTLPLTLSVAPTGSMGLATPPVVLSPLEIQPIAHV
jgi:hypothetical protein